MIIGSFNFRGISVKAWEELRYATQCSGLEFNSIREGFFSGGYYLHKNLPWKPSDFFYKDDLNGTFVLLSGSIFNSEELVNAGEFKKGTPDPEIIAGLYNLEGPDFVKRLNGDFVIFLFRIGEKDCYLFRDQVGIRPVAWIKHSDAFFFSTDINGLCRTFSNGSSIDTDYLLGFFKYVDYKKTADRRVNKVPPGHFIRVTENGVELVKYWSPEKIKPDKRLSHDRMIDDLRSILLDSVRIRCDKRFRAGAHVSSGLDSGIVSALVRREYINQDDFYGFSWSPENYIPPEVKFDERELVRNVCDKAGIKPLFSDMTMNDFLPTVSSFYFNTRYFTEARTVEQAVNTQTNLIFSGWGGDEFISTGERAIDMDLLRGMNWRVFYRRIRGKHPRKIIKRILFNVIQPALGILYRGTAKAFEDDARYLKQPYKSSDKNALRNFYYYKSRHQLHLRMLKFYHIQERCETLAINGYRKGIEYRYPLLDRRIIEYMLKVPTLLLESSSSDRIIMREIGRGILPEENRLHNEKRDPVFYDYLWRLYRESAIVFMDEVEDWMANTDLHFIDFELLSRDIDKYKSGTLDIKGKVLFRAIVYIKSLHEFSLTYHGQRDQKVIIGPS